MIYFKSVLVGLIGAVIAAVLWILVSFTAFVPMVIERFTESSGSAGIGAVSIGSGEILLAALIGFVVAGLWAFRRSRVVR
jgi:hypothetical protein